jgi:hypothetical protein
VLGLAVVAGMAGAAPITVGADGALLREGKPYRGIGVNYFDCFTRCLENPEDTSYREGFKTLAEHEIPFVRASFGGFYPANWKLYQNDKETYFRLMDNVVKAAEESGIGIIPSLFWAVACIPDLVGEPCNAWGKPDSKTHAFMRQYVREVVGRYVDSKAIWAWEFGNEYSLAVDLPNAADHRPPTPTQFGAPATRSAEDDLTSEMINTAFKAFAEEIRRIDPVRPITTGNATPRHSAEHLRNARGWKTDSREDLMRNLAFATPDPMNMVSIHVYPGDIEKRFEADSKTTYADVLRVCLEGSAAAKKPLFIGEFGGPPDNQAPWNFESAKVEGLALLKAIEESKVPLAAIWVFDFAWQDDFINISTSNHRAHYLGAVRDANRRIKEAQAAAQRE